MCWNGDGFLDPQASKKVHEKWAVLKHVFDADDSKDFGVWDLQDLQYQSSTAETDGFGIYKGALFRAWRITSNLLLAKEKTNVSEVEYEQVKTWWTSPICYLQHLTGV